MPQNKPTTPIDERWKINPATTQDAAPQPSTYSPVPAPSMQNYRVPVTKEYPAYIGPKFKNDSERTTREIEAEGKLQSGDAFRDLFTGEDFGSNLANLARATAAWQGAQAIPNAPRDQRFDPNADNMNQGTRTRQYPKYEFGLRAKATIKF